MMMMLNRKPVKNKNWIMKNRKAQLKKPYKLIKSKNQNSQI